MFKTKDVDRFGTQHACGSLLFEVMWNTCNTGGDDHVIMGCTIGWRTQDTISASLVML